MTHSGRLDQIMAALGAEECPPLPAALSDELKGYSGARLIGALQRLGQIMSGTAESCYCEVGVFRGLTLLSVAGALPGWPCFGVDNFSQFDRNGENEADVRGLIARHKIANAHLLDLDYEAALAAFADLAGGRKIGLYFVDGPHDYRSQMVCLLMARPHLTSGAAIVVDDCNYAHVRQANRDFLVAHPDFKLVFESYTDCHPEHMSAEERQQAEAGWWNGVNIILHDPEDQLQPMEPPTDPDRTVFVNDHIVHAHSFAPYAVEALDLLTTLRKPWRLPYVAAKLIYRAATGRGRDEMDRTNTRSRGLLERIAERTVDRGAEPPVHPDAERGG